MNSLPDTIPCLTGYISNAGQITGHLSGTGQLVGAFQSTGGLTGSLSATGQITGALQSQGSMSGNLSFSPTSIPGYAGPYTVTPSPETQVLETHGLVMTGNVTVNPIPSNYGLITWNGSVLTVS